VVRDYVFIIIIIIIIIMFTGLRPIVVGAHLSLKFGFDSVMRARHAAHSYHQVMLQTSHVTRHTSHVTRHTSHVTRYTSLLFQGEAFADFFP
jgi:hypothetical protein